MAARIRKVDYFYASVRDQPGEGYRFLTRLAQARVNLLAFSAIPVGPEYTQLVLFPEDTELFVEVAREIDIKLTGPDHAFLIQGDDELGALARIHAQLSEAKVNVYASTGITDGQGGYGYVVYVRANDFGTAAKALGI